MVQFKCQNLAIGYDAKVILHDLSFSVHAGDYLCIVGENGVGKSTLIKTILGLQSPIHGKVMTGDGFKLNEIGYLPQQTLVQRDFPASVREVVISGCLGRCGLRPFYNSKEKQLADKMMERMGISALSKCCYRELSGGQQQRVLLARALCATRSVLLLDEPFSGLDPKVTRELYAFIDELNHQDGMTIVMITHDVNTAVEYASHILHIGKTVFFGTKEEYLEGGVWQRLTGTEGGKSNE